MLYGDFKELYSFMFNRVTTFFEIIQEGKVLNKTERKNKSFFEDYYHYICNDLRKAALNDPLYQADKFVIMNEDVYMRFIPVDWNILEDNRFKVISIKIWGKRNKKEFYYLVTMKKDEREFFPIVLSMLISQDLRFHYLKIKDCYEHYQKKTTPGLYHNDDCMYGVIYHDLSLSPKVCFGELNDKLYVRSINAFFVCCKKKNKQLSKISFDDVKKIVYRFLVGQKKL